MPDLLTRFLISGISQVTISSKILPRSTPPDPEFSEYRAYFSSYLRRFLGYYSSGSKRDQADSYSNLTRGLRVLAKNMGHSFNFIAQKFTKSFDAIEEICHPHP